MCAFSWAHCYPTSIQESVTKGVTERMDGRMDVGRFAADPEALFLFRVEAVNRILWQAQ